MRTLVLILILACAFGSAALWQQARTQRLREERVLAAQIAAGDVAMTQSGVLGENEAVVVIGRPAGRAWEPAADTKAKAAAPAPAAPVGDPNAGKQAAAPAPLGDFVLEVSPGQSLSKIASAHYGRAPLDLVTKLAKYNGMADANALRSGMKLKLPPLERLGVVLKP